MSDSLNASQQIHEQNHPLFLVDRDHVDRLLAKESPEDADVVDLARLFVRYEGFPGEPQLQADMMKILKLWHLDREMLNTRARKVWSSGFRPGGQVDEVVGSGFDTSDKEVN